MGVPGLYSFLSRNYPRCITKYENAKCAIYNEFNIDALLIDGNACLHPVARKYYFTNDNVQRKRLTGANKGKSVDNNSNCNGSNNGNNKSDKECYNRIGEFIEELFLRVKPKVFYFAIDGTVNLSKSAEQRKRRFLSVKNDRFDTCNISVATPWMKKLHTFLKQYFIYLGVKYQNHNFIYDSYLNVGEGEHRLIDYIRNLENDNLKVAIHANDADVIPLMLGLHRDNCYILRDRIDGDNEQCSIIDISTLREELLNKYLGYSEISDFDKINSIIFVWYFVGMDFLPRCPSLEIFNNGLEDISASLHKTMIRKGSIVTFENNSIKNKFHINIDALIFWMREISKRDCVVLQRKATDTRYTPDPLILKNCVCDTNKIIIDELKYKKEYNETHFGNNFEKAKEEYVKGLWWTFEYYTHKTPSWNWFYPFHYSPYISDIADYLESKSFKIPTFEIGSPVPEELQLLYILPPHSFYLLPKQLHYIKDKYPEMFPSNVTIDKSGIEFEWEQKVLLPFADFETLKNEYKHSYPYKRARNTVVLNILIES